MKLTNLKKQDFEKILENYDIGKYKSDKHVWRALQNTVYILKTSKDKYILKIFERSNPKFVNFQINVMDFAERKGASIPKIMKTNKNKKILMFNNHRILIQEFVKGKEPHSLTYKLIKDVAKKQALMNKTLLKIKLTGKHTWGKDYQFRPMKERVEKIGSFNWKKQEQEILKDIKILKKDKLRKSVLHGDFHSANLLVRNDKLKAIIDWDDVHEDFIAYEIAVFITHSFTDKNRIKKKQIRLYLKEYQKILKLDQEEKKAIYFFIKNRFLATLGWCVKQRKRHKDYHKKIGEWISNLIGAYKNFNKISLEEFLEWF